uniref:Secreted protein n=1 Tax=Globodera pallida TaxID=36090 RepID=A0A183C327_GLOPA
MARNSLLLFCVDIAPNPLLCSAATGKVATHTHTHSAAVARHNIGKSSNITHQEESLEKGPPLNPSGFSGVCIIVRCHVLFLVLFGG